MSDVINFPTKKVEQQSYVRKYGINWGNVIYIESHPQGGTIVHFVNGSKLDIASDFKDALERLNSTSRR